MRIMLVCAAYPPMRAGEAEHAYHLAQQLAGRGHDVHLLTTDRPDMPPCPGVKIHAVARQWGWRDAGRLGRVLARVQPDATLLMFVGWIYNYHPMVTFLPRILRRVCPISRMVTLFESPNGADPSRQGWLSRAITKLARRWTGPGGDYLYGNLLRDSDGVIALSGPHLRRLIEADPTVAGKGRVIPPPPLLVTAPPEARAEQRRAMGLADDDCLFTFFGLLYPRKGIETLLRAFAALRRRDPRARLAIVGGSIKQGLPEHVNYRDRVVAQSEQLGLDGAVAWVGDFDSHSDTASRILRASDAAVFPFDFGIHLNNSSFAAAAAHGLPVITTHHDHLEPVFVEGQNVMLVRPGNHKALAQTMHALMAHPALRQRLAAGVAALADEWFAWDRVCQRIEATLGLPNAQDNPRPVARDRSAA